MTATLAPENWTIGNDVVLRTRQGEEISSTVFAYDSATTLLVLREPGSVSGAWNLRLLNVESGVELVSSKQPKVPFNMSLPAVDPERARKREEKACQQASEASARVGAGVSRGAQAIFDALVKTMPCSWRGQTIVVLDVVTIKAPYGVDDVSATDNSNTTTLERVKKVLEAERARLGVA